MYLVQQLYREDLAITDGCVLVKVPTKTLYVLNPQTGFNGTFLRIQCVLELNFVKSVPMKPEGTTGKPTFPLQLILFLCCRTSDMAQLSVVLSGSCSQQRVSRCGTADLSADKEVVDFLAPRTRFRTASVEGHSSGWFIPRQAFTACSVTVSLKALQYSRQKPILNQSFLKGITGGPERNYSFLSHHSMLDNKHGISAFSPK